MGIDGGHCRPDRRARPKGNLGPRRYTDHHLPQIPSTAALPPHTSFGAPCPPPPLRVSLQTVLVPGAQGSHPRHLPSNADLGQLAPN